MCPETIDSYENIRIEKSEGDMFLDYIFTQPSLSDSEMKVVENADEILGDYSDITEKLRTVREPIEKEKVMRDYILQSLEGKGISSENTDTVVSLIIDNVFWGYGRIGGLMRDDELEEVMINGVGLPILVVHRKYGICRTNITYENHDSMGKFIGWVSEYTGREISEEKPLLDGHMPDGSRINIATPPAVPNGPSVTIRKFKKKALNVIDLINNGTLTPELAAFFWVAIDGFNMHPCNILIAGGTGSGKTTLFNALAMFIPATQRIITVEDTLELNFEFLEDWIAMESMPSTFGKSRLSIHMLLQNSLRMRPDRVIVGEVRGEEAETLFVAMDVGHNGSMCTIHANNARETTIRLINEPMNVPIRMIPLVDVIIVMNRYVTQKGSILRRMTEVSEISGIMEGHIQMGEIFLWDKETDKIDRTEYPILTKDKISERCGVDKKHIEFEIYMRKKILEHMVKNNIKENDDVLSMIHQYQMDKKTLIQKLFPKYASSKKAAPYLSA